MAMNRDVQDSVLALVGGTVLAVGLTDIHLRYVRPGMQVPLIVAGGLMLLVGLVDASRDRTPKVVDPGEVGGEADHHAAPDEHGPPRTAWLLVLPVLVMMLITPGALGSFTADRQPSRPPDRSTVSFPPLPADSNGAVDLSLSSFTVRVAYSPETLAGRNARLVGFVSTQDDGWSVTRIGVSCCAADGVPVRVRVTGPAAGNPPPLDSWVEVVGTAGDLAPSPDGSSTAALAATPRDPGLGAGQPVRVTRHASRRGPLTSAGARTCQAVPQRTCRPAGRSPSHLRGHA